jgi:hypothetical protein
MPKSNVTMPDFLVKLLEQEYVGTMSSNDDALLDACEKHIHHKMNYLAQIGKLYG